MKKLYKLEETYAHYSKLGTVAINDAGILRVEPFVEHRIEVTVDPSVEPDIELDDIPPHLKQIYELYFYSLEAIYPRRDMIACFSPGVVKRFIGKTWVDHPYNEDWAEWEKYKQEMPNIHYPFIVLPHQNVIPKTIRLMEERTMKILKTLNNIGHRQITIQEFEKTWIHLFNPKNHDADEWPVMAWLHVAETPGSYVDVVQVNNDKTATVLFTVPPLMSYNIGHDGSRSSVIKDTTNVNYQNMAMRAMEESSRIPGAGNERIYGTLQSSMAEPEELEKHKQMWEAIANRYGFSLFTDVANSLDKEKVVEKQHVNDDGQEGEIFIIE